MTVHLLVCLQIAQRRNMKKETPVEHLVQHNLCLLMAETTSSCDSIQTNGPPGYALSLS